MADADRLTTGAGVTSDYTGCRPGEPMSGIDHGPIEDQAEADVQLQEMSWPAVAAVSKDLPVVVPIAAVEQHGRHLPVFTDSMLLGEVVRRAAESLGDRVVWAPLLWLGNSHHHMDFAGTLSAAPRTYLDLLGDLIDNLVAHGFRRIVLAQRPRRQHRAGVSRPFSRPASATANADDLLLAGGDLLASGRQAEPGRSVDRAGPDGTRLRVGDLDDPAPGAALGRRSEPDRAGPADVPFEPAVAGLDHSRAERRPATSATPAAPPPRRARPSSGSSPQDVVTFLERVIDWDGRSWDG